MASRLRLALYCAIRIHSIKMCNTADTIIIIIIIIIMMMMMMMMMIMSLVDAPLHCREYPLKPFDY